MRYITLAVLTPTRPSHYLPASPGDVRRYAHIHMLARSLPSTTSNRSWVGALAARSHTTHTTHHRFGCAHSHTATELPGCISWQCWSLFTHPHARVSDPSTTSNGSWVSRPPKSTKANRRGTNAKRGLPQRSPKSRSGFLTSIPRSPRSLSAYFDVPEEAAPKQVRPHPSLPHHTHYTP